MCRLIVERAFSYPLRYTPAVIIGDSILKDGRMCQLPIEHLCQAALLWTSNDNQPWCLEQRDIAIQGNAIGGTVAASKCTRQSKKWLHVATVAYVGVGEYNILRAAVLHALLTACKDNANSQQTNSFLVHWGSHHVEYPR